MSLFATKNASVARICRLAGDLARHASREGAKVLLYATQLTANARFRFVVRTFAEFLKLAGAPIVLLFVQSFVLVVLITAVIAAIAVLAEAQVERLSISPTRTHPSVPTSNQSE
jgi:hypothetical protein